MKHSELGAILDSEIQFLSKHCHIGNGIRSKMAPGATRKQASSTYSGYPQNEGNMLTWALYNMYESRVYKRDIVGSLYSSQYPMDNRNYFMTKVEGLIKVDRPCTYEIRVGGDDVVQFQCNETLVRRGIINTIKFKSSGWYPFEMLHQDSSGGQAYSVEWRYEGDTAWNKFGDDHLAHYVDDIIPGLIGNIGSTGSGFYNNGGTQRYYDDMDAVMDYIKAHRWSPVATNHLWLDSNTYRYWSRGDYWGYELSGYIMFPESGEWEVGMARDDVMVCEIKDTRFYPNQTGWAHYLEPSANTIFVKAGVLYPIKILAAELWGSEYFLFGVKKKGADNWIKNLTGKFYHDAIDYNGVRI